MSTPDFFRARLDQMIDLRHPLAVLATRMPWQQIEASVAPLLARKDRRGRSIEGTDLFGPTLQVVGAGVSAAGRPRLAIRLMVSLLYLKHAYGLSDQAVVEREGRSLRRRAGGYAHAKQFKRLRRVLKRQRTVLGRVLRDVQRRLLAAPQDVRDRLQPWLERAERIRSQRPKDKHKLYALHAPEVECIGKGKARQPYEFGVKVSVAVTAKQGLMVGARSLPGNPYDGHTLAEQLEQTTVLLQDLGVKPHTAIVDLGYRGADAHIGAVTLIHRGKSRSLTRSQRRWLKRRQAVEPAIGHAKHDHGMKRCWLKGAEGDALHAVLCAAGFNIRWLLRAIARRGIAPAFLRSLWLLSALAASASRLATLARPALLVGAAR
jgi:IS5 family transposase